MKKLQFKSLSYIKYKTEDNLIKELGSIGGELLSKLTVERLNEEIEKGYIKEVIMFDGELIEDIEENLIYLMEAIGSIEMINKAIALGYVNDEILEIQTLLNKYGWTDNWKDNAYDRYLELLHKNFKFFLNR